MCRNTAEGNLKKLNKIITGDYRNELTIYAKKIRAVNYNPTKVVCVDKKGFAQTLEEIESIFVKIIENSKNKNYENMIGTGFKTSTPKKTLRTIFNFYKFNGSIIPSKQKNEHTTQATGEEKIKIVA